MKALLESPLADVNRGKHDDTTPLYIICQNGHTDLVEPLLAAGADVNCRNVNKATPLFIASQSLATIDDLLFSKEVSIQFVLFCPLDVLLVLSYETEERAHADCEQAAGSPCKSRNGASK